MADIRVRKDNTLSKIKPGTNSGAPTGPLENPTPHDPMIGKVLGGRFRVLSVIARGGMGKVYRAEQSPLNRIVALKILDPSGNQDDDRSVFRERFFLEASTCAKLNHPNTVRIFDYGSTWDDVFYIAMEYLEGRTLHQVVRQETFIQPLRLLRLVKQICGSLNEAHQRGVIHRDLKPSNIFLTEHGEDDEFVKVLDFGLVKSLQDDAEMTDAGRLLGSPMYMSPEQVQCEPLDVRTDVYSIGMLMYVALTGKRPFKKTNSVSVLLAQIKEKPPAFSEINPHVSVPDYLEWVVMTCLSKDRNRRFADVRELIRALKACETAMTTTLDKPLKLRLDSGLVVVPNGLLESESFDVSLEEVTGPDVLDSQTFQLEATEPTDTSQRFAMWAGVSAAGLAIVLSLLVTLVVLFVVIFSFSTEEGTSSVAPAVVQPTVESKGSTPAAKTQPKPVESGSEAPEVVEKDREITEQKENFGQARSKRKRGSSSRRSTPKDEKVQPDNGQGQGFNGSLTSEKVKASPKMDVDNKTNEKKEAKDDWGIEEDIRDPWAGER